MIQQRRQPVTIELREFDRKFGERLPAAREQPLDGVAGSSGFVCRRAAERAAQHGEMDVGIAHSAEAAADPARRVRVLAQRLARQLVAERVQRRTQSPNRDPHIVRGTNVVTVQDRGRFGEDGIEQGRQNRSRRSFERRIGGQSVERGRFGQRNSLLEARAWSMLSAEPARSCYDEKGAMLSQAPPGAKKILVVDDESAILQTLRFNLERNGYIVATAGDGRSAIALAGSEKPDLIIMDIMLPGLDGIEACKEIRKSSNVPIIMLTAKDQEIDKVLALELGADDYVTKPFSLHEFLARVKARLRRRSGTEESSNEAIALGEIVLDPSRQSLVVRGRQIGLAPKEFNLLLVLMENRGRIVTRQTLLDKVWGYDFDGEQQTISVHVRWLREKVEIDPNNPRHIITVRGRGYMFKE